MAQLLHLESEDPDKDINLYINSPGGDVSALLAIYDTMQYIKPDVSHHRDGSRRVRSRGARPRRFAGQALRVAERADPAPPAARRRRRARRSTSRSRREEIIRLRKLLDSLIAKHTGQPLEKVEKDTDRDFILTADEALEYGILDEIITRRGITPELAATSPNGA